MIKSIPRSKFLTAFSLSMAVILLVSCGSYQQASYYDDDGIYSSREPVVRVEKQSAEGVRARQQESDIYGDYFGQKASEYGEILDEEIFTDIDGYSSQIQNDSIPLGEQTDYFANNNTYIGNPGWGDNPTNLTINVYDNWGWGGGLGWGWGWNDPWLWNGWGWGGLGWGWGWNNWGWNRWGWGGLGWGWGWNNWGWNRWGWALAGAGAGTIGAGTAGAEEVSTVDAMDLIEDEEVMRAM